MDFAGAYSWANIRFLLEGVFMTLQVALIAIGLSFAIAVVVGVLRYAKIFLISPALAVVVETIRNLPLLLIIFFAYFALPEIGIELSVTAAAITGLTVFESAMVSEIVRGGLHSVEKGQIEAARSTGLTYIQTMRHIILPQALRRMVPPIVSQFISLIKDTSLAVVISLPELINHAQIINGHNMNYVIPIYLLVAVMYFIVNYMLSIVSRRLENQRA